MTRYLRQSGALARALVCGLLLVAATCARASVAILLEEPYGDMGRMNPTGHSAVYLDHVCAETPTELRPCREGELGAVISRYDDINGYDWLAIPLVPYLYAVENASDIPLTMDRDMRSSLRDAYRHNHLQSLAADLPDGTVPGGNWYELVGSAYDRTIYGFQVKSTSEQDAGLIALFNDRRNVQRYNGAFRNCADFTRVTINRFYPHAIRRNFIADFGLTTPKSVARALSRYAAHHPETEFKVFKIPQVPGSISRSQHPQGVAESLLKKYGVPIVLLSPATATVVLVAYIGQGRFAVPKNAPVLDLRTQAPTVEVASVPKPVPQSVAEIGSGEMKNGEGSAPPQASIVSSREPTPWLEDSPAEVGFPLITSSPQEMTAPASAPVADGNGNTEMRSTQ